MNFEGSTTYEQLSQDTLALSTPQVKASCFSLIGWLLWAMSRHAKIMANLLMFGMGRRVGFCINGCSSCLEITGKITSAFSWNDSFIGSYGRGYLWFPGSFRRHSVRNQCAFTWVVPKGLQAPLLAAWERPAPLGMQRSPLIMLFNVRGARVGLEKSLTCLWSASRMLCVLRAEQSFLMVLSAHGAQFCLPFTHAWWLGRGHGAADDQTHHVQGVMSDEKVRVCTQWLPQFDLPLAKPATKIQKGKMFPKQNSPALLQKRWRHPEVYLGNHDAVEGMRKCQTLRVRRRDKTLQQPQRKRAGSCAAGLSLSCLGRQQPCAEHFFWESGKLFVLAKGSAENSFQWA